ncbi:MAG: T9SS type A sorting domain-containing protein [Bacteroidia bacterium]
MRRTALLTLSLSSSLLLAQAWRAQIERIAKEMHQRISRGTVSTARTQQTVTVIDSYFVDLPQGSGWQNDSLIIYRYTQEADLIWDTAFRWQNNNWTARWRTNYLYYSSGLLAGLDSAHIQYGPGDLSRFYGKRHFTYAPAQNNSIRVELQDSTWDSNNNRWAPLQRITLWFLLLDPNQGPRQPYDSLFVDIPGNNPGQWVRLMEIRSFFRGTGSDARVDSQAILRYIDPPDPTNLVRGWTKYTYDAQRRLTRQLDTLWLSLGGGAVTQDYLSQYTWYTYLANPPTLLAKDSVFEAIYDLSAQEFDTTLRRRTYAYNNDGRVTEIITDTCNSTTPSGCGHFLRERYVYRRISLPTGLPAPILEEAAEWRLPSPQRAGTTVAIQSERTAPYRLIDLSGRLVLQGELSAGLNQLTLPTQPGLYILQIGQTQQKLLLVP